MRINYLVARIISAPNFDHFTTIEVRSAYLALNEDKTLLANNARRFVYAELTKLVKHGWLRKTTSRKKEITSFVKTELFDAGAFEIKEPDITEKPVPKSNTTLANINQELISRLNGYKSELLTGMGEIEEYKRLCEHFPILKDELQPRYNQVRENNSKLLGSIKAIESLVHRAS